MKKKTKTPKAKPFIVLLIGVIMLILTPLVFKGTSTYLAAGCVKNEYGTCPIDVGFPNLYNALYVAIAWGVISIVVIGVGVFLRYSYGRK